MNLVIMGQQTVLILPKVKYRFKAVSVKVLVALFVEINNNQYKHSCGTTSK